MLLGSPSAGGSDFEFAPLPIGTFQIQAQVVSGSTKGPIAIVAARVTAPYVALEVKSHTENSAKHGSWEKTFEALAAWVNATLHPSQVVQVAACLEGSVGHATVLYLPQIPPKSAVGWPSLVTLGYAASRHHLNRKYCPCQRLTQGRGACACACAFV